MAGRKRKGLSRATRSDADVPDVYQDMLEEAGASGPPSPDQPPRKRKRPGERHARSPEKRPNVDTQEDPEEDDEDGEDAEFEDVVIPAPSVQTVYRDSDLDDSDDEEELQFEDVDIGAVSTSPRPAEQMTSNIELNLSAHKASAQGKGVQDRRKPMTRAERERRIQAHQIHLLCLLVHAARRNRWCNDEEVQQRLRALLSPKIESCFRPRANLSQFGRMEALKDGLRQISNVFRAKFRITERGLRRSMWADDPELLSEYEPPDDLDSCVSKDEFRESARTLQGSRDVGAQLFCALLRCAGVRARVVCSLQPLAFAPGGPTLPKPRERKTTSQVATVKTGSVTAAAAAAKNIPNSASPSPGATRTSTRRRLGHSRTAAYQIPAVVPTPPAASPKKASRPLRESPFPVYWVEVLDVAHQKWHPVDPIVTESMWKPAKLEPPASDRDNCMSYVVAFEADGTARDVTRRYAKAYTAKTRRLRIESGIDDGERWWRMAMKYYTRRRPTDLDQIEDNELSATALREPMPRNVADFKDHPVYALERHLRRHEVLVPGAKPAGTIAAGNKGSLEKIYRRDDVRMARSRDKWYRLGRQVRPMELPVKFVARRANAKVGDYVDDGYGGDEREAAGTPLFTMEQTDLYKAPPIKDGRVPKNRFGNIDLYVPSMVPEGGVHIPDVDGREHERLAARAAFILGIDYAPALMGFQFKGRQGTAVLNGIVVAREQGEAVRAVMDGLMDAEAEREAERRAGRARRMWKRFWVGLQIRERIYAGVDPEERAREERRLFGGTDSAEDEDFRREAEESPPSDDTEEYWVADDDEDDGGGGFIPD
ncbi:hypothetical protein ACRALDRAFT_1074246 [Sodiomyces alcalophilus JCM 7366]|uniref:uncharacterized protein n=1 Tax=Sodiomyces alcalophilus JCM 7366 TaxID=591952 RepID=UPI0039B3C898